MDPLRHGVRAPMACGKCTRRCAASAKFCANCGAKLPRNDPGIARHTKLPLLGTVRPATVTSPLKASSEMPSSNARAASPMRKKRPLPTATKKPARIAKLEIEPRAVPPPSLPREAEPTDDYDHKLKFWMASTRRLLESVLELKRRLDRPELEDIDPTRFQSIGLVLTALRHDLDKLEPCFVFDRNLQAKCEAMLTKLSDLYQATQHQLPLVQIDSETSPQRQQRAAKSPAKIYSPAIADAEVVIRGRDGKQIFFRARKKTPRRRTFDSSDDDDDEDASPTLQDHDQREDAAVVDPLLSVETRMLTRDESCEASAGVAQPHMAQFMRERWPDLLVFRVARVEGRAVFLRLHESDELHQLVVDVYRPLTSRAISVSVPLEWLAFVLPPSMAWYRVSEVRRYKAVEAHWSQCFDYIVRCLKWTPAGDAIGMRFPIQFRQARMFTFRSFAAFYGLLTVQVLAPDYTLKITFLNARTHQRVALTLPEKAIARCLVGNDSYRERMVGTATRKTLCMQVCDKLYFEYTSRGFELLFPGIKPRGAARRHPQELCLVQHRADQLELEHKTLKILLDQCIQQTVVLARRRMESYLDRVRRAKKARQDAAAKKIQARTRGLVAKHKVRRQRDELRRTSRLQELAAVLIQREFRRRQQAARQKRALEAIQQDTRGVRFRLICRVNGSFVLANVALDELDAVANAFDCVLRVVHPSTSQKAELRIAHGDVLRLLQTASLAGRPRSEIVRTLLSEHIDVFRSARHDVLVLALRNP